MADTANVLPRGLTVDLLRKTIGALLPPGLTIHQLRRAMGAVLEMESHLLQSDPNRSEARVVRQVLGRMLVVAEELERSNLL
jgi:hypothetical protein